MQSDFGMLLARTDFSVPKHAGISWFAFPLDQPGVTIRPLREMTGEAVFNEVFFDDAVCDGADLIGGAGNGWAVTQTTLFFERTGIGAGGAHAGLPRPGPKGGLLGRRAGDAAPTRARRQPDPQPRRPRRAARSRRGALRSAHPPAARPAATPTKLGQWNAAAGEGGGRAEAEARPRQPRQARARPASRSRRRSSASTSSAPTRCSPRPTAPRAAGSARAWCSRRRRRSTAAPTRSSATSSPSELWASPVRTAGQGPALRRVPALPRPWLEVPPMLGAVYIRRHFTYSDRNPRPAAARSNDGRARRGTSRSVRTTGLDRTRRGRRSVPRSRRRPPPGRTRH